MKQVQYLVERLDMKPSEAKSLWLEIEELNVEELAPQLDLGGLTKRLNGIGDKSKYVYVSNGPLLLRPDEFSCYRGYYDHLCLSYTTGSPVTVDHLLTLCRDADGATHEGYKGGEYKMDKDTPVWVAEDYGDCSEVMLVDVVESEYKVSLIVRKSDD